MSPASLLRCVFLRRRNGRACCFIKNANSLYRERLAKAVGKLGAARLVLTPMRCIYIRYFWPEARPVWEGPPLPGSRTEILSELLATPEESSS